MAYLIRSKGCDKMVRDGKTLSSPVYKVSTKAWTKVEHLPAGTPVGGDKDFDVNEIVEGPMESVAAVRPVLADKPPEIKTVEPEPEPEHKSKKHKKW